MDFSFKGNWNTRLPRCAYTALEKQKRHKEIRPIWCVLMPRYGKFTRTNSNSDMAQIVSARKGYARAPNHALIMKHPRVTYLLGKVVALWGIESQRRKSCNERMSSAGRVRFNDHSKIVEASEKTAAKQRAKGDDGSWEVYSSSRIIHLEYAGESTIPNAYMFLRLSTRILHADVFIILTHKSHMI